MKIKHEEFGIGEVLEQNGDDLVVLFNHGIETVSEETCDDDDKKEKGFKKFVKGDKKKKKDDDDDEKEVKEAYDMKKVKAIVDPTSHISQAVAGLKKAWPELDDKKAKALANKYISASTKETDAKFAAKNESVDLTEASGGPAAAQALIKHSDESIKGVGRTLNTGNMTRFKKEVHSLEMSKKKQVASILAKHMGENAVETMFPGSMQESTVAEAKSHEYVAILGFEKTKVPVKHMVKGDSNEQGNGKFKLLANWKNKKKGEVIDINYERIVGGIKESTVAELEADIDNGYGSYYRNIRKAMEQIWEAKKDKHLKGATKPEEIDDKESKGSKDFADEHDADKPEVVVDQEDSHKHTDKATGIKRATKRPGDQSTGDGTTPKKVDYK